MSNTPIQIPTDLGKMLEQINQTLNSLQKEVTDFRTEMKVELAIVKGEINTLREEVKGEISNLKTEVSHIKEDLKEIKGSQKAQIWTLIGVLRTAVLGTVIRFVITALPNP